MKPKAISRLQPMNATTLLLFAFGFAISAIAGVEQDVQDLIPRLAAEPVEDRYGPQMELQRLAANASRPGAESERLELATLLAAKVADQAVPQTARVWMVRQLEYIGAEESVASLTVLLNDPDAELKECARRALEKNTSPAATESLRRALSLGGETSWKIGLLHSLGEREDAPSVALIAKELGNPQIAPAAASALAKLGTEPAVQALWSAYDQKNPCAADALIKAANRLATRGEGKRAIVVYTRLYGAATNVLVRPAALVGLAKADPTGTKKLIPAALSETNWRLQNAAVVAAREIYGTTLSANLGPLLPKLNPSAKVFVLRALDASAEDRVIAAVDDPDLKVKVAALETLAGIGSGTSIPTLMKAALEEASEVRNAANLALARVAGPGADKTIGGFAAQGSPQTRAVAIKALAERTDRSSVSRLLTYASEPDSTVSTAACAALGKLGADTEFEALARLAMAGATPGADTALQSVASRLQDRPAAAHKLIVLSPSPTARQLGVLLDTLPMLGGAEALDMVSRLTSSTNDETKDAAVRALGSWPDFQASQLLLLVAKDPTAKPVHRVLALQGVARLVKNSEQESPEARLEAALAALELATRTEDKKLVLSSLASVPDARAADPILRCLSDPSLQPEANLAALNLARELVKKDRVVAQRLAQAVKDTKPSAEIMRRADAVLRR